MYLVESDIVNIQLNSVGGDTAVEPLTDKEIHLSHSVRYVFFDCLRIYTETGLPSCGFHKLHDRLDFLCIYFAALLRDGFNLRSRMNWH